MIDQHQVGLQRTHGLGDLFGLAGAYVIAWIGGFDTCGDAAQDLGTSRLDQLSELFGSAYRVALPARMREDDDSTVAFLLTIKQSESTFRLGGSNGGVAMAVVTIANAYIAAGHYGRDGVFVDHLADLVAQQHHTLIERLDRPLQLDAVDEVDGDRNAFTTQSVKKRILQ
jgi:hypothetical protein